MATREELYQALRNADAAGDAEGARKLAAYISTMPQESAPKEPASPMASTAAKILGPVLGPLVTQEGRNQLATEARDLTAGAIRGAGSIGASLMWPIDKARDIINADRGSGVTGLVTGQQPMSRNEERRAAMDAALEELGADPNSILYKGGKLGAEVAGTAGAGGAVANLLGRTGFVAPNVLRAIETAGLQAGTRAPGIVGGVQNALARAAGGAINGGASVGMVNPEDAAKGAAAGAILPGAVQIAGATGNLLSGAARAGAKRLMQSALKPTINQLRTGDADVAVNTLLDYGLSPTSKGVNALRATIDDINQQIDNRIASSNVRGATVDKASVMNALADVRNKFGNQVSPTADLEAIQRVADDFAAHPAVVPQTPVQVAQDLKKGTYRVLGDKYGQMGSAETEAQKALARGLKEGVANAVPEVGALNAEESRLLKTLDVTERRALMELNKNPVGLAALASNPAGFIAFMADRSAGFKALAARMINAAAQGARTQAPQALLANPLARNAGLITAETNP